MAATVNVEDGSEAVSVFLSYSHDDRARALPVIKALEAQGFTVWWDGLLEGGTAFAQTTETALETSDVVVVLWSARSVQSHWVRDEATRGRDRGCMVPVSIDGTEPPLGFRQIQYVNLAKWRGKAQSIETVELAKAVRIAATSTETQIGFARTVTPSPSTSRRNLLLGGGVLFAALGGGIVVWKAGLLGGNILATSLAVLPFANLSGDPKQSYFSDGLAAEIRTVLSRGGLLQIAGQASSNTFRGRAEGAQSIARALDVSFLLEGNVQMAGELVKITTNLTDGKSGLSKWAESYERPLADIFAVQAEIAAAVASALSIVIDTDTSRKRVKEIGGTKSVAALDAYLRGRELFELHIDETSERAALAKFDEAIRIDPDYAAARAARSRALAVIASQYGNAAERIKLFDSAVTEAETATRIAPQFAAGFNALGYALFYGRLDAKAARRPFEQAYALATSDVDVLNRYAIFCARTGRFAEANQAIERASKLDPLNASVFRTQGNIKFANREYEAAINAGERALKINPKRNSVNGDIGDSFLMIGELDKARRSYEKETNSLIRLTGLAILDHRVGRRASAQENLAKMLAEHGDNGFYQKAQILAQWGKADAAITALQEAKKVRDAGMGYLLNDPFLDPIRKDPRFDTLLAQMGFN